VSEADDIAAAFAPNLARCLRAECRRIIVHEDGAGHRWWTLYGITPKGVREYEGNYCSEDCAKAVSASLGRGEYRIYQGKKLLAKWRIS
jgi:hypothetical protein